jgi:hypothetical protein
MGGQVRRLPDDPALQSFALADQVADHDEPGGDANANLDLAGRGRIAPSDRGNGVEASAHRSLGIVFVGPRKSEINQYTVAHVFSDDAVEAANRPGHAPVIGADHLAQFFRIESRRQRRRADQVAEHHRQLPPLGRRRRHLGGTDGAPLIRLSSGCRRVDLDE